RRHRIRASGMEDELVLQRVDQRHLSRIVRIEELDPHHHEHVFRVALNGMRARLVKHCRAIVIVVDDLRRYEAARRNLRERDRRALRRVDDRPGIEGIPVHPDDGLGVEGRRLADMVEAVDAARERQDIEKAAVAFSADGTSIADGVQAIGNQLCSLHSVIEAASLFVSLTCCKSETYNKSTPLCEFNGEIFGLAIGGLAGIRTDGEIFRTNWEYFKWDQRQIELPREVTKTNERRLVPICD